MNAAKIGLGVAAGYLFALAYLASFITYQTARAFA